MNRVVKRGGSVNNTESADHNYLCAVLPVRGDSRKSGGLTSQQDVLHPIVQSRQPDQERRRAAAVPDREGVNYTFTGLVWSLVCAHRNNGFDPCVQELEQRHNDQQPRKKPWNHNFPRWSPT